MLVLFGSIYWSFIGSFILVHLDKDCFPPEKTTNPFTNNNGYCQRKKKKKKKGSCFRLISLHYFQLCCVLDVALFIVTWLLIFGRGLENNGGIGENKWGAG